MLQIECLFLKKDCSLLTQSILTVVRPTHLSIPIERLHNTFLKLFEVGTSYYQVWECVFDSLLVTGKITMDEIDKIYWPALNLWS